MIPGSGGVIALFLQCIQKIQDKIGAEMIDEEGLHFDAVECGGEREKQGKGLAVGSKGMWAYALDPREIVAKELMQTGGKFHMGSNLDLANSISRATSFASVALR